MFYDENSVTEIQQKAAQQSINCIMDGFKLKKPPHYIIRGLNLNEKIASLEQQKLKQSEKEIKKIEKKISFIKDYADNYVKVVFEFDTNLKKLIYMSKLMKTAKFMALRHNWSGVLDFPITSSFIFGRVCYTSKHGGGDYYFASFEKLKQKLVDKLEKLNETVPDLFPYKIIELNEFIDILGNIKFTKETISILRWMPETKIIKSYGKSTSPLVDKLNQNKKLIKIMETIPHFGTTKSLFSKFTSEIDVSTIFIPYREVTYFNIDHFTYPPKKHCRAIYSLLKTLEELTL